jgi:predicted ribosomally synthesized peptide with nif11-like leader
MSKQAWDAFKGKLADDQALRDEFTRVLSDGGGKRTAPLTDVVAFAKSKGFDFSEDEVKQTIELSDEQLDAVAGGASFDAFIKLDGIKGESSHKDHIEIMSFSWGLMKR